MTIFESQKFERWKQRILKTERNKKWTKRKQEQKKQSKEKEIKKEKLLTKIIDKWQEERDAVHLKEMQEQQRQKLEYKEEMEKRKRKAREGEELRLLIKLEKLRAVRKEKLVRQGAEVSNSVSIFELISEAGKFVENEQKQKREKESKDMGLYEPAQLDPQSLKRPQDEGTSAQSPLFSFYNQSNESVEKLLSIRQNWDSYLVDKTRKGYRIPPTFLQAPLPGNPEWAKFLVQE